MFASVVNGETLSKWKDKESLTYAIFVLLGSLLFFIGLGQNDIWTTNEGFYAEAVREMFESGNFLDIFYNYEPRYNKPPLLYWIIALSSAVFGLNEFAIRLPVVLSALTAIYYTYQIGALTHSRKLGQIAALIMFFSFQFAINARYASPAVPLTFFFTWTVYLFVKAYLQNNRSTLILAYIALGLTMLMKGFPYLIIIVGIGGLFIVLNTQMKWKPMIKGIASLGAWWGIPLATLIGMSWITYMYIVAGSEFHEVFMNETFRRAFNSDKPVFQLKDLGYYLDAIAWGFAPYSLTFYIGLVYLAVNRFREISKKPVLQIGLAWFVVMYVVFTISRGKIPTYFIQAHPALSLLTAYAILDIKLTSKVWKGIWNATFWIPGITFLIAGVVMIYAYDLSPIFYALVPMPMALFIGNRKWKISFLQKEYLPFTGMLVGLYVFMFGLLPQLEEDFRRYDEIGQVIEESVEEKDLPLLIEGRMFHNLPYYAQRKVVRDWTPTAIENHPEEEPMLIIVEDQYDCLFEEDELLWEGYLYGHPSESRFLMFMVDAFKQEHGQKSDMRKYQVYYRSTETSLSENR
jgi:4-amino-4-deoxy-L-arabinose transferase-like glycosyltransferase